MHFIELPLNIQLIIFATQSTMQYGGYFQQVLDQSSDKLIIATKIKLALIIKLQLILKKRQFLNHKIDYYRYISFKQESMQGSINHNIKDAINDRNLCGAAEKLATYINARQEACLKAHIERQWLESRRLVLSNMLEQKFHEIQYKMKLLQCDQKDKIPHRILLNSMNKPYPGLVDKKYIPGNFIHRQFSAYCQYFAEKYFSKEKITLTQEKTKGINQFSVVQDYVNSIQKLVGKINQKTQNYYASEGKKLILKSQNLLSKFTEFSRANNFERYQLHQIKGNPKDIWDKFSDDFRVYKKNIKKDGKFSQLISKQINAFKKTMVPKFSMVFKDIQDNFQCFKNEINERNYQQNQLRTNVEQHAITSYLLNSQIPRINDYISYYTQNIQEGLYRNRFVNNYLKKQNQKRKNQIKTKAFDFDNMQKEICNFGLGRVSYATKTQFFVLSPLCFDEGLSQGFSYNHQKQYYHVEKQILRAAQEKINQLKKNPQVQLIIIDMFTQLQPCCRSQGQNSSCAQFIGEWQKKMELDPPRKLILRISYNNSNGTSSENSQEVEVGKIQLQDQKGYDQNHHLKLLFKPEHVFGCRDLNLNTYRQTVQDISKEKQKALREMKVDLQFKLQKYQNEPHGRCLA